MTRKVACDLPRCERGSSRLIREIFVGIEVCEYDKLKVGGINERIVCLKKNLLIILRAGTGKSEFVQ